MVYSFRFQVMRPISPKIKQELENDPRMKHCIACKSMEVEWDHALTYAGRQLDEPYAIQPLCTNCHRGNSGRKQPYAKVVSELTAISMGLQDLQKRYPKTDWLQRKKTLEVMLKNTLL